MRRPVAAATVGVVFLAVAGGLAGCAAPEEEPAPIGAAAQVAALRWPTLRVLTTPSEPFEQTRPIQATWQGGLFAVWAEAEADLAPRSVVDGETVHVNRIPGMGWTSFGRLEPVGANSERLVLWDLPRLVATPGLQVDVQVAGDELNATVTGLAPTSRGDMDVTVRLLAVGGEVVWGALATEYAREAPFTFHKDAEPFPFEVRRPDAPIPIAQKRTLDVVAQLAHTEVIKLLRDYQRNHAGTLPEEPSPESLAVELLASGKEWPDNPFSQEPLAVGAGSGDIGWNRTAGRAVYTGFGWDGALVTQSFVGPVLGDPLFVGPMEALLEVAWHRPGSANNVYKWLPGWSAIPALG